MLMICEDLQMQRGKNAGKVGRVIHIVHSYTEFYGGWHKVAFCLARGNLKKLSTHQQISIRFKLTSSAGCLADSWREIHWGSTYSARINSSSIVQLCSRTL